MPRASSTARWRRKRQPGSAFKPFVYLTALERGLTPDTVREDKPIAIKGWKPENYGHEYFGPVTLTPGAGAFAQHRVGAARRWNSARPRWCKTAHRLGIASKLEANASIALGTSEVSLLELVTAYAPFANGGNAVVPHVVERVRTLDGKTLYARAPERLGRVIEPRYVAMMNEMMRETLHHRHRPQGRAAGLAGRRQDRHLAGFPRRLVRRLHRPPRHRGLARQRRRLADQEGDRRRPAGRGLEPVHEGGASGRAAEDVPMAGNAPAPPAVVPGVAVTGASARQAPAAGNGLDGWFGAAVFSSVI